MREYAIKTNADGAQRLYDFIDNFDVFSLAEGHVRMGSAAQHTSDNGRFTVVVEETALPKPRELKNLAMLLDTITQEPIE